MKNLEQQLDQALNEVKHMASTVELPIYNQIPYKVPPGLYLGLFHGRKTIEEELDDWGFNGPIIGPLKFCHITYGSYIKPSFSERHPGRHRLYGFDDPTPLIELVDHGTLVPFQGAYYGDWTLFIIDDKGMPSR